MEKIDGLKLYIVGLWATNHSIHSIQLLSNTFLSFPRIQDTMSDFTAAYSDVLDLGREKMNEGDYLKLAQFLSSLHKTKETKEQPEIFRESDILIDIKIELKTSDDTLYNIKIDKCHTIVYRGPRPNAFIVYGSIDGIEFMKNKDDLVTEFTQFIQYEGGKDIKQTFKDNKPKEFKTFKKFKKHCMEVDKLLNYDTDTDDEGDDYHYQQYHVTWYIACLFGINKEIINN